MNAAGGKARRPWPAIGPALLSVLELGAEAPSGPVLVNGAVRLQPARFEDFRDWALLREESRAHLTAWEPAWAPGDMTESSFRRRVRAYWREIRAGTGLPLFIRREADGRLVGGASLSQIRYGAARSASIGYWVGAPFIRQGFAIRTVESLVDHAFSKLGLNRVEAACQPDNAASRRLLEKAGFSQEGLARDYLKLNGAWRDHLLFAVTARDHAVGRAR